MFHPSVHMSYRKGYAGGGGTLLKGYFYDHQLPPVYPFFHVVNIMIMITTTIYYHSLAPLWLWKKNI